MPPLDPTPSQSQSRRRRLHARTALCGVLCSLNWLTALPAQALPTGGLPEVSAGGGNPDITVNGSRMDVKLNAERTVLSWTSFDVTRDETVSFNFGARNWIVLNRVLGLTPSKIEGVVEGRVGSAYGGNVWFTSQNSIIFGKGSQIDAGSLLVAIGTPDTASFLNPSNNLFSFSGGDNLPNSRVFVLSNAKVTAHGGMVAMMGPTVSTRANAMVSATNGSVIYGSARNFQIRMAPGTGGDFDLVDFVVPNVGDGADGPVAIDLGGDTRANSVFLAAVSKSAIGSAVINLEGMVTAQAAKADGGDIVLSGGGGISNRAAAPSLSEAASTDIYLNKASASRDLQVRNVGRMFGRPWVRPLEELKDPTTLEEDANACSTRSCDPEEEEESNGGNSCGPNGCFAPDESMMLDRALVSALFDPTSISAVVAGRDANIQATANIELGRVVAARDLRVSGPEVKANALIASGNLTATSTTGDVLLAGVGVSREGVITAAGDARIDAITAPTKLTVTSGRDISLGDGVSTVTGAITLSAPQNVLVQLGSGKIDSITAGANASLRGGALEIGTVTAPRMLAQAESIKIGKATTSGDLYVVATSGDATVTEATAGDDVYVIATNGTASLGTANLTGTGADAVQSNFAGNPDVAGNGRVVLVESTNFDARLGLGVGGVTGATAVTVRAGQDAVVDVLRETPGAFSVVAARDATLKAPTVRLDAVTSGRDLTIGSTTGDFTLINAISATRNITVSAAGALRVADVTANAGSVTLVGSTVTAGAVSASEDLTLRALTGGVTTTSYRTGRDLIVQGTTLSLGSSIGPVARDLSITSLGNFTSNTALSAGRNLTLDVNGTASIGQATAGQTVRIVASDLALGGTVSATDVQIEARGGSLRVGGAAGGSGFILDNGEFGQLRVAGQLRIYAGTTTGGTRGNLLVQDLTVNPTNTPNVAFLVGSSATASVQGLVAPTASGGILRIGDATDLSWRPDTILVSGGVGAATYSGSTYTGVRSFNEVRLAARQDILMGSQRFIDLVQSAAISDIDIAAGLPAGVTPTAGEVNRVFVSAGKLEVSADNKVVQQNTSALGGGQAVGVFFTGQSDPALIIDPPRLVELWGAFAGQGGQVVQGQSAGQAVTFTVVDTAGRPVPKPDGASYRFNSCDVGTTTCAPVTAAPMETANGQMNASLTVRDTLTITDELTDEAIAAAVSSDVVTTPPVVLAVAAPDPDEIVTDPVVTGAGSEEIWRQRRQKQ
ncbi:MAG: filamentous hemagglutinin N-terminal domain-containing protein [Pseudomonadota bacterium]